MSWHDFENFTKEIATNMNENTPKINIYFWSIHKTA